jgi:hypothetical protein
VNISVSIAKPRELAAGSSADEPGFGDGGGAEDCPRTTVTQQIAAQEATNHLFAIAALTIAALKLTSERAYCK